MQRVELRQGLGLLRHREVGSPGVHLLIESTDTPKVGEGFGLWDWKHKAFYRAQLH